MAESASRNLIAVASLVAFLGCQALWAQPIETLLEIDLAGRPTGVALDSDGNTYVTISQLDIVQKFDPSGNLLATWTGFERPTGISVSPDGLIYVTEVGGNTPSRVRSFTPAGAIVGEFPQPDMSSPYDVEVDTDGNLYVILEYPGRLDKLSPSGALITSTDGAPDKPFFFPRGVGLAPGGEVLVADPQNGIYVFSEALEYVQRWSTARIASGVSVDNTGGVYVAEFDGRIEKFEMDGGLVFDFVDLSKPTFTPNDVVAVSDGRLIVSDANNFRVLHYLDRGAPLFADGFESGDTSAWSTTVP